MTAFGLPPLGPEPGFCPFPRGQERPARGSVLGCRGGRPA